MTLKLQTIGSRHSHHAVHSDIEDETAEDIIVMTPAIIFDAAYLGEEVPAGFDAVRIVLDGTLQADLSWKKEHEAAVKYVKQGLKIFWEIDLGLFQKLKYPLSSHTQFLSLSLSLEHFRDTLWKLFRESTIGLCLYRGSCDFTLSCKWKEEQQANLDGWLTDLFGDLTSITTVAGVSTTTYNDLRASASGQQLLTLFCRDAASEYFDLLASRLPDTIRCFVLFEGLENFTPAFSSFLLCKNHFLRICVGVKNGCNLGGDLAWESSPLACGGIYRQLPKATSQPEEKPKLGICLPELNKASFEELFALDKALQAILEVNLPFRAIPESMLTMEWDGLDYLIVLSKGMTLQGRRKLQGFCAAGGTVVTIGALLNLNEEKEFEAWFRIYREEGKIVLEPVVQVPEKNHWIYKDRKALVSLMKGIKDAEEGRLHDLGSFAKYAKEDKG